LSIRICNAFKKYKFSKEKWYILKEKLVFFRLFWYDVRGTDNC
jgi:hypothetical protein